MNESTDPLAFSSSWFELGITTNEEHEKLVSDFLHGQDKHPEHFRWRAFKEFLQVNPTPSDELMRRLYRLGQVDPDFSMGGSIMTEIVKLVGCPKDILEFAAADTERPHLRKLTRGRI